jgi:hypothetical protein
MTFGKPGQMISYIRTILFGNSEKNRPPGNVRVRSRIILKSLKYGVSDSIQLSMWISAAW